MFRKFYFKNRFITTEQKGSQKKLNEDELKEFRTRFNIPVSDSEIAEAPFYKPAEDSPEMVYLKERRSALGGSLPKRFSGQAPIACQTDGLIHEYLDGSGDRELATTMAYVHLLAKLLRDPIPPLEGKPASEISAGTQSALTRALERDRDARFASVMAFSQSLDGKGPPSAKTASEGFKNSLITLSAKFTGKCAMLASFVDGKGSAVSMDANRKGAVCSNTNVWKQVWEHTGHTEDGKSIDAYCADFIPEASAMAALSKHSPGAIIAFAKQGQLGVIMPGLKDQLFIVTAKPEYGECLFTSAAGTYGAAICTCDTAGCNNQAALGFVVDRAKGPMRLLQFIEEEIVPIPKAVSA